jgi:hypothetical protein
MHVMHQPEHHGGSQKHNTVTCVIMHKNSISTDNRAMATQPVHHHCGNMLGRPFSLILDPCMKPALKPAITQ